MVYSEGDYVVNGFKCKVFPQQITGLMRLTTALLSDTAFRSLTG
jgi:hypothetical protein